MARPITSGKALDEKWPTILRDLIDSNMSLAEASRKYKHTRNALRVRAEKAGLCYRKRALPYSGPRSRKTPDWDELYGPTQDQWSDAERRRSIDRPTLTAKFFGDPLPGYSSLDRRPPQTDSTGVDIRITKNGPALESEKVGYADNPKKVDQTLESER